MNAELDSLPLYLNYDALTTSDSNFHRRLSTPGYVDFVVLVGLSAILYYVLRTLRRISDNWRKKMEKRIEDAEEKRKSLKDPFRTLYGYSWDYCMVFKVAESTDKLSKAQEQFSLKHIINRLADAGLQTKLFYSVQNDEVYVKIRASLKRLKMEADRINYRMQLEPAQLANCLLDGNMKGPIEKQWKPINVPTSTLETTIDPYEFIYCDYKDENEILFKKWPNNSQFRGVDRLKLIAGIMAARLNQGGCYLDVYRLIKNKCMITIFPLHDAVELRTLEEKWLRFCQPPWKQHVDVCRDYFGEKIALFFLWLGHYTTWLIVPSILGFFAWVNVASDGNNPNAVVIPYYCVFIAIWSTLFLEYWKRKEKDAAMRWGMVGFEEEEQARPEFFGSVLKSPIDGSAIIYFPPNEFYLRVSLSVSIISILIVIVLGMIASIFLLRIVLSQSQSLNVGGLQLGSTIAALINAVQIQILNAIYGYVAIYLTEYENHRTDTEYEDALIAKTFIFQFVNSFASLFYIAYVKPFIQDLDPCVGSCFQSLQTSLGSIFLTRLATGSILKVAIPYVLQKMKERTETAGADIDDLTDVELQYMQAEYHVILGTFADYADMSIQFGYATMFIAAYPLAMILSCISNYVALRINAWKLCQQCRRAVPRSVEDIGTWYIILEVISISAVLTNAALVTFTASYMTNYEWSARVWTFLGISAGVIIVKAIIAAYVPDTPLWVDIQLERNKFYIDKIIHNVPDEDDSMLNTNVKSKIQYTIRINDDDPL